MKALLSFLPLFRRQQRGLALALALSLVTLAAGIGLLGVSGWFLTAAAISTAGAAFNIFAPSAGVRGLSFLRILSRYGEKISGHDATLRLLSDIRRWLFEKLFPILPFRRGVFGRADLVGRLTSDVDALDTVFLFAFGPISTALLAGTAMSVALWFVLPGAVLPYVLAYFGACLLVPPLLLTVSRRPAAAANASAVALRSAVLDGLDAHHELVVFDRLDTARQAATTAAGGLARLRLALGVRGASAAGIVQALAAVAVLGTLVAGLSARDAGAIDGPLLAGVLLAVMASFEASALLVRGTTRLAAAAAAAERLRAIADECEPVRQPVRPAALPGQGRLQFEGVRFGYDPARPVLAGLSFDVAPGECVAFAGPSGSGKSTVAMLAARLADPQSGSVLIDDVDLRAVSGDSLRRAVAVMTQDAPVFLDSVRDNLLIGRPDADDAALWTVLDAVGLKDFVAGLPKGLDTMLGEAGRTVSSGQGRRLCLARTLLSHASIIILDEPTAGLDREAEVALLSEVRGIADGRTMLVITHADLPEGAFDRVVRIGG